MSFWRPGQSAPALSNARASFAVAYVRRALLFALESTGVVVLAAEGGAGKSSQVVQYLDEAGWTAGGRAVCCVQTTRAAAAAAAARVAEEIRESVGRSVCVSARGEPRLHASARIVFSTCVSLISELRADATLARYAAVLVDDAHVRGLDTDVLLGLLRGARAARPELRLVVMCATIEAERIARYFSRRIDSAVTVDEIIREEDADKAAPPTASAMTAGASRGVLRAPQFVGEISGEDDDDAEASLAAALAKHRRRTAADGGGVHVRGAAAASATKLELPDTADAIVITEDSRAMREGLLELGESGEREDVEPVQAVEIVGGRRMETAAPPAPQPRPRVSRWGEASNAAASLAVTNAPAVAPLPAVSAVVERGPPLPSRFDSVSVKDRAVSLMDRGQLPSAFETPVLIAVDGGAGTQSLSIQHSSAPVRDYVASAAETAVALARARPHRSVRDVLLFLPSATDVSAASDFISEMIRGGGDDSRDVFEVRQLTEAQSPEARHAALAPAPVTRDGFSICRIIIATSLAETLRIPGIGAVVDSGWTELRMVDAVSRMEALTRVPISRETAAARARAATQSGLLSEGCAVAVVVRLYTRDTLAALRPRDPPEISRLDPTRAFLLAAWGGAPNVARFPWIDAPRTSAGVRAFEFLAAARAVDPRGGFLPRSHALAELITVPLQPEAAATLLRACELGCADAAVTVVSAAAAAERGEPPIFVRNAAAAALAAAAFGVREGDAPTIVNAVRAWEAAGRSRKWAVEHGLYQAGLLAAESMKADVWAVLRDVVSGTAGWTLETGSPRRGLGGGGANDAVASEGEEWEESSALRRALVGGYAIFAAGLTARGVYETLRDGIALKLAPGSVLTRVTNLPPFIVCSRAEWDGGELCVLSATAVSPHWLLSDAPLLYAAAGGWTGQDRFTGVSAASAAADFIKSTAAAAAAAATAAAAARTVAGVSSMDDASPPVPLKYKSATQRRAEEAQAAAAAAAAEAARSQNAKVAAATAVADATTRAIAVRAPAQAQQQPPQKPTSVSAFLAAAFEGGGFGGK